MMHQSEHAFEASAQTLFVISAGAGCRKAAPIAELGSATVTDGTYIAPAWGLPFPADDAPSLDVMKTGTIIDSVELPGAHSFCTFGRSPGADVLVEHPSTSRLHAVLQFRGRQAFLVDCSSTHGSFLNRAALAPFEYHAVHVGAQFRFGQSTRSYILAASSVRTLPYTPVGVVGISWLFCGRCLL